MATITLHLKTAAPLFLNGSDARGTPEFRAPSVRGQLRYWARALIGAATTDLAQVWAKESAVFGSTGQGSAVTIRLTPLKVNDEQIKSVPMLPHRMNGGGNPSPAKAIIEDTTCRLVCMTRPAVMMPPLFEQALVTWLLLGGIGKRSRRMFGAFSVTRVVGADELQYLADFQSPVDYQQKTAAALQSFIRAGSNTGIPAFPTLHPAHSHIIIGKDGYESAQELNQKLFRGILRSTYRQHQDYFGTAMGGRRASPLIAQVRQIGDEFYPVLTYMRSRPELPKNKRADWKIVNDFMADAKQLFKADTVWGGDFK